MTLPLRDYQQSNYDVVTTKQCRKCNKVKPLDAFNKDKSRSDGHHSYCRTCKSEVDKISWQANKENRLAYSRKYNTENRAQVAARKREYAAENAEKLRIYGKQWRSDNADALRKSKQKYAEANKEMLLARRKEYALRNPEVNRKSVIKYRSEKRDAKRESARNWMRRNKHRGAAASSKRRAERLKATPKWANGQAIGDIYHSAHLLRVATGEDYHVDHRVPLKHSLVCGLHVEFNLQILPAKENLQKNNHYWEDMP